MGVVAAVDGGVEVIPAILKARDDVFPKLIIERGCEAVAVGLLGAALGGKEAVAIAENFPTQVEPEPFVQAAAEVDAEQLTEVASRVFRPEGRTIVTLAAKEKEDK